MHDELLILVANKPKYTTKIYKWSHQLRQCVVVKMIQELRNCSEPDCLWLTWSGTIKIKVEMS